MKGWHGATDLVLEVSSVLLLQAWPARAESSPAERRGLLVQQAMVHRGFTKAWRGGTLHKEVIGAIRQALQRSRQDASSVQMYLTGCLLDHCSTFAGVAEICTSSNCLP
jgi:hypothetical protein